MDIDKSIDISIKRAEEKEKIIQINKIFNYINYHILKTEDIIAISETLHINSENIYELLKLNFSIKQAIGLVWYFYDKTDKDNNKIISDNKISEIFKILNILENKSNLEIEEFDLYDLIGLYKSDLCDTRNNILIKENQYIKHIISSISAEYSIILNQDLYEEFISELNFVLINLLNQINTNNKGQMLKFIGLTLKGRFRTYLKKYKTEYNLLSLNNSKEKRELIEKIEDKNENFITNVDANDFSESMMQVLSVFSEEDFKFIVLKYQEGYTNEDLSSILGMSEKDVNEKDKILLNSLRENEKIKQMKKCIL